MAGNRVNHYSGQESHPSVAWLFLGLVVHVFLAGALEDILDLSMQVLESDIPFLPQAGGFAAYLVLLFFRFMRMP